MDSILGSVVATITIAFLYFMFRRNSQPIFKKNKRQLLMELIPIVVFCIFFPKVIKIAIIFLVVEIILYIVDYRNGKKKSVKQS
ncbi:hypothetical protein [uncultured Gemella sp.]|uniref:hypothetical protein n=1 Tax=uncultured Gemella sp. TaxID=254352 RepID=UPI0026059F7D|nr:hypothetical protein [uncultured Gemella sp.]